jgi:hypothetical protein
MSASMPGAKVPFSLSWNCLGTVLELGVGGAGTGYGFDPGRAGGAREDVTVARAGNSITLILLRFQRTGKHPQAKSRCAPGWSAVLNSAAGSRPDWYREAACVYLESNGSLSTSAFGGTNQPERMTSG